MSVVSRLSSPGFDEETRTYLQLRVRLLAGAVTLITGALAAAFLVKELRASEESWIAAVLTFVTTMPNAALFWLVVGALLMRRLLKRRRNEAEGDGGEHGVGTSHEYARRPTEE